MDCSGITGLIGWTLDRVEGLDGYEGLDRDDCWACETNAIFLPATEGCEAPKKFWINMISRAIFPCTEWHDILNKELQK